MRARQAAAGIWLLSFAVCADGGTSEEACTVGAPSVIRLRSPDAIAFIGIGVQDTVLAGAGSVQYTLQPGHSGPGRLREIYGQVVRVERLERNAPDVFRSAIAADSSVVVVPWDYGSDCRRVPWNRSARWLAPGSGGAFVAQMRDRAQWTGGRPTFAVIPELALYPAAFPHQQWWASREPQVTAQEFLTLYELLPDHRSLIADPDSATAPLIGWVRANPDQAAKLPVIPLLSFMRSEARMERYRRQLSPIAGTYRVIYRAASGDSSAFYMRTEGYPTSLRLSERVMRTDTVGLDNRRPIGHTLLVQLAPTLAELPKQRRSALDRSVIHGYIEVIDSAAAAPGDSVILPGTIDLHAQALRLAGDSAARSALTLAPSPTGPGRFIVTRTGRALRACDRTERRPSPRRPG